MRPIIVPATEGRHKRADWVPLEEHHTKLIQIAAGVLPGFHRADADAEANS